jgi:hypothetical protein
MADGAPQLIIYAKYGTLCRNRSDRRVIGVPIWLAAPGGDGAIDVISLRLCHLDEKLLGRGVDDADAQPLDGTLATHATDPQIKISA